MDFADRSKLSYLINFIVFAYILDISLSGWVYLVERRSELVWTSPYAFLSSLTNLHTGQSIFGINVQGTIAGVGNHVLILISIGFLALSLIKIKCGKLFQWSNFSHLRGGILYAGLFIGFAIAVHEMLWYFSYYIVGFPNAYFMLTSAMFVYGSIILVITVFARPLKKEDGIFVLVMSAFYAIWVGCFGFDITVGFNGNTQWILNSLVNTIENASWAIMVPLVWLCYYYLPRKFGVKK